MPLVNVPQTFIPVEVAYALAGEQVVLACNVSPGSDVRAAIIASGVLERFPQLELAQLSVGVFSKICTLDRVLQAGERVEIYRPLQLDPKQRRALLARQR
jgi:uncharacterized protein